jgi:uncharacterized protein YecE (DUF72 family)
MIKVGLAGWGDHDELYESRTSSNIKLKVYSEHFSSVEVDSSFYAILSPDTYKKWIQATTNDFSFIIKAYQVLTGHSREKTPPPHSMENIFQEFCDSIKSVLESGKLKAVLFQYPPWFDCTHENIKILRLAKRQMKDIPVALEFRHQSWFFQDKKEKTLAFMEQEGWIHSICDEPQAGAGSVPAILHPTNSKLTIIRMHGRNKTGWNQGGTQNWREVRYLYRYSEEELLEWKNHIRELQDKTEEIHIIFNNNSGGDAAGNAKQLELLLGKKPKELAPRQLNLFDF